MLRAAVAAGTDVGKQAKAVRYSLESCSLILWDQFKYWGLKRFGLFVISKGC